MDYKDKYIKYKTKYLKLKDMDVNNLIGGSKDNLIIHVSGPSGSGKTTLGNKLKEKFKSKIIVKDLDDLRAEFIDSYYSKKFNWENFDSTAYQAF